jgi:exonuclease V
MEKLHKRSIRATDIASQYWCERQMELNYIHGSRITKEIQKGKQLHEELENETNLPIVMEPRSYADVVYKMLYTSHVALQTLKSVGRSREIQIYGIAGGFDIAGKIDMLEIKDSSTIVWEDKTKASDNLPSDPQFLTHRVQIMLYKRLIDDIREGRYTLEQYNKTHGTSSLKITSEFARQLDALTVEKSLQTVSAIAAKYFDELVKLPKTSPKLKIRYLNQFTGKEIKTFEVDYDAIEMGAMLDFALGYWKGQRESMPVPKEEMWKCNYCAFFGKECKVWWQQKTLLQE